MFMESVYNISGAWISFPQHEDLIISSLGLTDGNFCFFGGVGCEGFRTKSKAMRQLLGNFVPLVQAQVLRRLCCHRFPDIGGIDEINVMSL